MRGVYSLGLQATTNGPADGNNLFDYFLAAYGGYDIVTPDGKPHLDDPKVKEAVIKSITFITTAFKQGYVPPGALDWGDADDNNAFHAKQIVMDLDGTISTEVGDDPRPGEVQRRGRRWACPTTMTGKPIPSPLTVGGALIPKGGKNVTVAKEFLNYVIQPKVAGAYLKSGLARWLPAIPSHRQGRSVVDRSQGSAPARLCPAGRAGPDAAASLRLQSGHVRGQRRAGLGHGACQRHPRQRQSGSRSGRGA